MSWLYGLPNWILWLITVFALILSVLLYILKKHNRIIRLVDKLPGPKHIFFIDGLLPFLFAPKEDWFMMILKLVNDFKHAPLSRFWVGHRPVVVLYDASLIEVVLNSQKLIEKGPTYNLVHAWLGDGLLTSTGEKWRSRRKLITPSFHFKILEDFFRIIVEQAEILVDTLKNMKDKDYFNVSPYLARCTLDVICETAMARRLHAQSDTGSEYVKAVEEMDDIFIARRAKPWLESDWLFNLTSGGRRQKKCLKILHGFTNQVIRDRWAEFKDIPSPCASTTIHENEYIGQKRRLAFLDMLLENFRNSNKLNVEDIREEVDTFMFAGHDTTTSATTWILYNVGRFPEMQGKLHKELDDVFGGSNRPLAKEDLVELKYLELVIKESMRLFPPVPFFTRKVIEDFDLCGYTIPAGVEFIFHTYFTHRNEKYFPDPERFDPDRFLPENCVNRHPFAYIPFSAGPRNCIGQKFAMMELKAIICQILRNFEITSKHQPEDIKFFPSFVLRPVNGMWIKLNSR